MTSYATWMSNPQVQALTFGALKIPGTHDSATYSLTQTLSQVQYPEIAFLWKLNAGAAPADGSLPWTGGSYYVGSAMYGFVLQVVQSVATSQDQTILQQLNGGIRYFDLRIYYDTSANDFFVQHGLRGCTLSEILQQVQQFISQNPASQELIILALSHANFSGLQGHTAAQLTGQVSSLVQRTLGAGVYVPPGLPAGGTFTFQALGTRTVAEVTNGKPAVMLLNLDEGYTYASEVINTSGFKNSGRSVNGVDTVAALAAAEQGPLQQNAAGKLYQVNWTLTPQLSDVMTQIQNGVLGSGATPVLQALALQANDALTGFIQANRSAAFNLVTVDWYETGTPNSVVDLCVALNTGGTL
jgi:hypothetical protein